MIMTDFFTAPNIIKVDEYYDLETYFDTETYFFYELDGTDEDGWLVREYKPTHSCYIDLMTKYRDIIIRKREGRE